MAGNARSIRQRRRGHEETGSAMERAFEIVEKKGNWYHLQEPDGILPQFYHEDQLKEYIERDEELKARIVQLADRKNQQRKIIQNQGQEETRLNYALRPKRWVDYKQLATTGRGSPDK